MAKNGVLWFLGSACVILSLLTVFAVYEAVQPCPVADCPEAQECEPEVKEVSVVVQRDFKQEVVNALVDEISADKDLRTCSGDKYDAEEISVKKVYDGFKFTEDSDGDTSISGVKVKLNYDDGDCYRTLTCGLNAEQELVC